jgi:trans-2-enoyl-CoA reductase
MKQWFVRVCVDNLYVIADYNAYSHAFLCFFGIYFL